MRGIVERPVDLLDVGRRIHNRSVRVIVLLRKAGDHLDQVAIGNAMQQIESTTSHLVKVVAAVDFGVATVKVIENFIGRTNARRRCIARRRCTARRVFLQVTLMMKVKSDGESGNEEDESNNTGRQGSCPTAEEDFSATVIDLGTCKQRRSKNICDDFPESSGSPSGKRLSCPRDWGDLFA